MRRKLIIDGNAVYEIDDDCICRKEMQQEQVSTQEKTIQQAHVNTGGNEERLRGGKSCVLESGRRKDIHACDISVNKNS